jgi:hypothetical protein
MVLAAQTTNRRPRCKTSSRLDAYERGRAISRSISVFSAGPRSARSNP